LEQEQVRAVVIMCCVMLVFPPLPYIQPLVQCLPFVTKYLFLPQAAAKQAAYVRECFQRQYMEELARQQQQQQQIQLQAAEVEVGWANN
jgi:hypothetical protein